MNTLSPAANAISLRNKLVNLLVDVQGMDSMSGYELMTNQTFQAALNALDPEAPCFVADTHIQNLVFWGARHLVSIAMQEAKAKIAQRNALKAQLSETERKLSRLYGPGGRLEQKRNRK